ncbi:hypothetical protein LV457_09510 [Mycobacterium sp. MYCO198283]|uniref:hypothetical protein n=1 Tax=Mycobacterium sp. MYCO198283 TaxID=2883505 RepID=UPI001E2F654E|nr:hypothetical protein [Mycobacterium sp. MYCO198283]MCG5432527.1 hypothetical protein [Mycobacterium sp. MYCO198283]
MLNDQGYWVGGNTMLESLTALGNRIVDDPGGWRRRGYRGRNVTLQSEDGQVFEVQLHTAASLDAAERAHPLYERARAAGVGISERKRLARQQEQLFDAVPWPDDLPEI